ncbi:crAss001_48 related protein [Enterococcus faecalis]|uniref:crAss001_48 related protein n=1 Tax=Enterococcus faecalis TaxID=1351 RepID=UPI0039850F44
MLGYQARVKEEYEKRKHKINALSKFLESAKFLTVSAVEQELLLSQFISMKSYAECLEKRIAQFK